VAGHSARRHINPLMPELNPSVQRCLMRFFYWGFCFLNQYFNNPHAVQEKKTLYKLKRKLDTNNAVLIKADKGNAVTVI
jgi:hypothetical protein